MILQLAIYITISRRELLLIEEILSLSLSPKPTESIRSKLGSSSILYLYHAHITLDRTKLLFNERIEQHSRGPSCQRSYNVYPSYYSNKLRNTFVHRPSAVITITTTATTPSSIPIPLTLLYLHPSPPSTTPGIILPFVAKIFYGSVYIHFLVRGTLTLR